MILALLLLIFFLLLQGYYSGLETGMVSVLRPRADHRYRTTNSRSARLMVFFLHRPNVMIATTLVGVNLSVVGASLAAKKLVEHAHWDSPAALLVSTAVLSVLLLTAEIIPKNWMRQNSYDRCARLIRGLFVTYYLLYLPIRAFAVFTDYLNRRCAPKKTAGPDSVRAEFKLFIQESQGYGSLDSGTATLLANASRLPGLTLGEIMVPRPAVRELSAALTVREAIALARELNLDRLPVFDPADPSADRRWKGMFNVYDAIYELDESEWDRRRVADCMNELHTLREQEKILAAIELSARTRITLLVIEDAAGRQSGILSPNDITRVLFRDA